ncbi:hypothetical protein NLU13_0479 [Sarocladium strictum]|uniref:NDT80 domain-containing protein n=1 Tax=Sarocladium strictum TaxID=5046 RepID=A0AA39LBB5_SARSR|nr:hypothetical protein NLU13_0479 [Sarocladium strictum]
MSAHAHTASSALPHPTGAGNIRERYMSQTPGHKRVQPPSRSPTYGATGVRRHDMSPLTATHAANLSLSSTRNERLVNANDNMAPSTPPLQELETLGTIVSNGQPIKPDITATIDKGFFLSDHEWTCYRRNYFSTVCSFTLSPLPQPQSSIFFSPSKKPSDQYPVLGWAMSISAVVSENTHAIELVQHTPKRDKGPTHPPEKVAMTPKLPNSHHHGLGLYADLSRHPYADNYGNPAQPPIPCMEHSFERIQFKQATQNNGKRRAAQQYYHLVVELFADVGNHYKERYIRVAFRKSAQMIVRGRSPGHYSTDRRGSQSSGANNQNLGTYQVLSDYSTNGMLVGSTPFTATYDTRTHAHNGIRHNDMPTEHPMTSEDEKAIESAQRYLYFTDAGMNTSQSGRVDLMSGRSEPDSMVNRIAPSNDHKVKPEYDYSSLPRQFNSASISADHARCGPFEGKPTSNGYYPNMLSQSGVNFSGVV